ncbi:hypothetical protein EMEDMD4_1090003 [Sinorhizobium medicae]|uniref:Uncharacterized protein n=1 Tax=Sinorhizobium medicae TaxID=110321 RepID=A0A508WV48_9HYPH|nr:hypothetical protein EMEDMD4_1090003 [Sinorhizobium medicae]
MSGVADDNFPVVQADPISMGSRPASVLSRFHDAISVTVAFCYLSRQAGGSLWPSP